MPLNEKINAHRENYRDEKQSGEKTKGEAHDPPDSAEGGCEEPGGFHFQSLWKNLMIARQPAVCKCAAADSVMSEHHFANRHAPLLSNFAFASNSASFARYARESLPS
jgi:hypothetical protein